MLPSPNIFHLLDIRWYCTEEIQWSPLHKFYHRTEELDLSMICFFSEYLHRKLTNKVTIHSINLNPHLLDMATDYSLKIPETNQYNFSRQMLEKDHHTVWVCFLCPLHSYVNKLTMFAIR